MRTVSTDHYDALFTPGMIGPHRIRNRLFVAPHTTNLAQRNLPSPENVEYLRVRAQGGAGLVLTEGIRVTPDSVARPSTMAGFDDRAVPGFTAMADAVHDEGAVLFGQLLHIGREGAGHLHMPAAYAVSVTDWALGKAMAHEMTTQEVAALPVVYADAAERLHRAGFDGIEVHIGHGHLLHQFLSPVSNLRTDRYGGSERDRLRVIHEILRAITDRCPDLTLGVRVSAHEFLDGGIVPETALDAVSELHEARPLDFINVSHSAAVPAPTISTQIADMSFPAAPYRRFPPMFKRAFPNVPVLAACRYDDVDTATEMVSRGEVDFIGMARGHIADPDIVTKWQERRFNEVTRCIACNACISRTTSGLSLRCVVNPEAGLEKTWRDLRGAVTGLAPRRILVVGGGPAGLATSVAAARQGHEVTLVDERDALGGRARVAALMHNRELLGLLVDDLVGELERLDVDVRLGCRADSAWVHRGYWEHVVIATGPRRPHLDSVPGAGMALTPEEAIISPDRVGHRVLLMDEDGGYAGAGLAEHLAHQGHDVMIITAGPTLGWRIPTSSQPGLLGRLRDLHVERRVNVRPRRFGATTTVVDTWDGGVERVTGVDTVIRAHPGHGGSFLGDDVGRSRATTETVGDALAPRGLLQALHDGRLAGLTIGAPEDVRPTFEARRGL